MAQALVHSQLADQPGLLSAGQGRLIEDVLVHAFQLGRLDDLCQPAERIGRVSPELAVVNSAAGTSSSMIVMTCRSFAT